MKKVLVFLFLTVFLVTTFVSASWMIPKQTTCNLLNATGSQCDELWCGVIDCNYNSSLEACVCSGQENNFNLSLIQENFYNKSDVELMFYNKTIVDEKLKSNDISSNSSINGTSIEVYIDSRLKQFKAEINGDLSDYLENGKSKSSTTGDFNPLWVLVGLVGIGILVFFMNKNKSDPFVQREKSALERGYAPSVNKKIQSRGNMEKDEIIKELKKELKEKQKDSSGGEEPLEDLY